MRVPGTDETRISLTMPVLRGAMITHVLITGDDKRDALERARKERNPKVAPICGLLDDATVHWAP